MVTSYLTGKCFLPVWSFHQLLALSDTFICLVPAQFTLSLAITLHLDCFFFPSLYVLSHCVEVSVVMENWAPFCAQEAPQVLGDGLLLLQALSLCSTSRFTSE